MMLICIAAIILGTWLATVSFQVWRRAETQPGVRQDSDSIESAVLTGVGLALIIVGSAGVLS